MSFGNGLLATLIISQFSLACLAADWMTCKETASSTKSYADSRRFSGNTIKIKVTGKTLQYVALPNDKGTASLDAKFRDKKSVRFVDESNTLDYSDSGEVALFLTKPVLKGKPER